MYTFIAVSRMQEVYMYQHWPESMILEWAGGGKFHGPHPRMKS
jgi:hypothetical protein